MPNKITVYLGVLGAIGAIELEVPGLNDLFPINANIAPNARGRRVEPGDYILDSIAYTPKTPEVQAKYGEAIIRFVGEDGNKLAIFGGEPASDGRLAPTEGSSVRVGNDALSSIVNYIEECGSEIPLMVTDDEPGLINSLRSNKWYGQPANTERIGFIRPSRFRSEDYDSDDWLMWESLYYMDDDAASQIGFYQTYDEDWIVYEDEVSSDSEPLAPSEEIPETGDKSTDDYERREEAPYIADPFCDTEQQNLSFENQNENSGPGDTAGSLDIDDEPDNNY